jgi:hypothetical protein
VAIADKTVTMTGSSAASYRLNVWNVLAFALFLRILLPLAGYFYTRDATIFIAPDTVSYVEPARELIASYRFVSDGTPEIIRTPGYPLLLTVGLLLGRLELVTIGLQILLSCFTVYMVYCTSSLLFEREQMALAAAALYALEPLSILYASVLVAETLFAALTMIWVYYLMRYLKDQSSLDLLTTGAVLAASVYVRPIGYFLPMLVATGLAVWALVAPLHDKRRLVAHIGTFAITCVGLISPWQLRNKVETGYAGFSAISSENMYFYLAASVLAAKGHVPYYEMQNRLGYQDERIYLHQHPEQKNWPPAQRFNYMSCEAEHILLGSPLTYARIHLDGILRAVFDPGSTEFLKFFHLYPRQGGLLGVLVDEGVVKTIRTLLLTSPVMFWSNALLFPMLLAYLSCACIVLFSKRLMLDPTILAALLIVSYYLVISGGPAALGRFRHPAMPIICVLAGYGLYVVLIRLQRASSRPSHAASSQVPP